MTQGPTPKPENAVMHDGKRHARPAQKESARSEDMTRIPPTNAG